MTRSIYRCAYGRNARLRVDVIDVIEGAFYMRCIAEELYGEYVQLEDFTDEFHLYLKGRMIASYQFEYVETNMTKPPISLAEIERLEKQCADLKSAEWVDAVDQSLTIRRVDLERLLVAARAGLPKSPETNEMTDEERHRWLQDWVSG